MFVLLLTRHSSDLTLSETVSLLCCVLQPDIAGIKQARINND